MNQHLFDTLQNLFGITATQSDMVEIKIAVKRDRQIQQDIEPILYECVEMWVNEMGYRWKIGETVQVVEFKPEFDTCLVCIPGYPEHRFEILAQNIRQYYKPLLTLFPHDTY